MEPVLKKRVKAVTLEPNPYSSGKYMLVLDTSQLPFEGTAGSYNVFYCRLLGIDYVSYLRFCRDVLGAEVEGKGQLYPTVLFKRDNTTLAFVDMLNTEINLALFDYSHDVEEMKAFIAKEQPIQDAREKEAFEKFKSEVVNLIFD